VLDQHVRIAGEKGAAPGVTRAAPGAVPGRRFHTPARTVPVSTMHGEFLGFANDATSLPIPPRRRFQYTTFLIASIASHCSSGIVQELIAIPPIKAKILSDALAS